MKKKRYFTEDRWLIPERRSWWAQMKHKDAVIGGVFIIAAAVIDQCVRHLLNML